MPDRRREVLEALRSSRSPLSILAIANRLGLHPNTVRFHLRALVGDGRVDQVEAARGAPGRPALLFRAHVGMDPAGPRNYQLLAGALAGVLGAGPDPASVAVEAGRAWAGRLIEGDAGDAARVTPSAPASDEQATGRMVEILDELGFAPERDPAGAGPIGLRHCPFLDLVPEHAAVICPLHLGLMQGALGAMGAGVTVTRLEPFAEVDLCLAHTGTADSREAPR
ncbi:helix-turn-helix transcriptional regulator [Nocardioides halotolerans]|uniref:helix-turn-helix transcriptional regulator n=1 Tax=Nocardioides halotolerans TaxID=433660 RepID=UPI00040C17DE|nr:helix-turn-helix domain-containing protein [Nocardioides halotolerans]